MKLDRFTIALLLRGARPPALGELEETRMQEAHMSHLADLHERGALLAAGPVLGSPDRALRGISILRVEPDEARVLKESDPSVGAGLYRIETYRWLVPAGAMSFARTRFPRRLEDVD